MTTPDDNLAAPAPDAVPLRPLPEGVQCIGCGYSLCGLTVDRACPECGYAISVSVLQGVDVLEEVKWLRDRILIWRVEFGLILLTIVGLPVLVVLFSEREFEGLYFLIFASWLLHSLNVVAMSYPKGNVSTRLGIHTALFLAVFLGPATLIAAWTLGQSRIASARWSISCGVIFIGASFLLLGHAIYQACGAVGAPLRMVSLPRFDRFVAVGLLILAFAIHREAIEAYVDPVIGLTRVRYVTSTMLAWCSAMLFICVGSALQVIKLGRPLRHVSRLIVNTERAIAHGGGT